MQILQKSRKISGFWHHFIQNINQKSPNLAGLSNSPDFDKWRQQKKKKDRFWASACACCASWRLFGVPGLTCAGAQGSPVPKSLTTNCNDGAITKSVHRIKTKNKKFCAPAQANFKLFQLAQMRKQIAMRKKSSKTTLPKEPSSTT